MRKTAVNEAKLEFPSRSENESFARSAAAQFAAQMNPTISELEDVKTAVSEAVTNAIIHAYPDTIGAVCLKLRVCQDNVLEVTVRDRGRGIADIAQARQPMFTTGGEERSGMGFTIMESFMDAVTVRSKPGRGAAVTMTKRFSSRRREK
ncbi:MAG: anti-sigma F factor [Oscillibacter sp.]|nr:anti-sigma F factor [Oscillibacter sp.]